MASVPMVSIPDHNSERSGDAAPTKRDLSQRFGVGRPRAPLGFMMRQPAAQAPARPAALRRRWRIAIAMPGGFDFGGIGRSMMYATGGWQDGDDAPEWWLVDARGNGRLWRSPWMTLRALVGLVRRRPDLLHLNVANAGSTLRKLVLSEAAHRLGIPTVVHLHFGDYEADLAARPAFLRRRIALMFQRARRVVVLGRNDRETVRRCLAVPAERIDILPNAVADPGPPPERAARRGPPQLIFLGRFDDPGKGLHDLLEALASPPLRERDWQLTVAGQGDTRRFAPAIERAGLGGRVRFSGWLTQEQVYELCRQADIFVLPSYSEGLAMSLLEAMAHGLAIVATPVGAHLEVVAAGEQALIVEPGNVAQLAAAMTQLIENDELRRYLGHAARRKYRGHFDAKQYAPSLLQIYSRALGEFDPNY